MKIINQDNIHRKPSDIERISIKGKNSMISINKADS